MDDSFEVVVSRNPDGLGFFLKGRESGRLFRVEPARDPRQPRFWCIRIYRCLRLGVADPAHLPWLGGRGMTREELPAAMAEIRTDVDAWLAQESCQDLRGWLLAEDAPGTEPPVPDGRARPSLSRSRARAGGPSPDPHPMEVTVGQETTLSPAAAAGQDADHAD